MIIGNCEMKIQGRLQRILIDLQPRHLRRQHIKNRHLSLIIRVGTQVEVLARDVQISTRGERLRKSVLDR